MKTVLKLDHILYLVFFVKDLLVALRGEFVLYDCPLVQLRAISFLVRLVMSKHDVTQLASYP